MQQKDNTRNSCVVRMFLELRDPIKGLTLKGCSKKSRKPIFLCLNLESGLTPVWFEAEDVMCRGESLMPNIGESPSVGVESSLSQIIEPSAYVDPKYFLSERAVIGI